MRPLRQLDPPPATRPSPLPEPMPPKPSPIPAPRASMPSNAIGSVMPGASTYLHSALLSGVAGYVDAAGFSSLIGLFPAHLTGEIVGDAIAFSSGHPAEHATRLWILPVFVGSVAMAAVVARALRRNGRRALTGLLGLVTAGLALFSASDALAKVLHESWHLHVLLGGACAVAAMGFQNALMRESLTGSCPTTVMTGNLTQVVLEIVDQLLAKVMRAPLRQRRNRTRLMPVAAALCAFIACAVLGGFLTRFWGSLSVLLPTALTGTLTYRAWREDRRAWGTQRGATIQVAPALPRFDLSPPVSPSPGVSGVMPAAAETKRTPAASAEPIRNEARALPDAERPPMKRTVSGTRLKTHRGSGD